MTLLWNETMQLVLKITKSNGENSLLFELRSWEQSYLSDKTKHMWNYLCWNGMFIKNEIQKGKESILPLYLRGIFGDIITDMNQYWQTTDLRHSFWKMPLKQVSLISDTSYLQSVQNLLWFLKHILFASILHHYLRNTNQQCNTNSVLNCFLLMYLEPYLLKKKKEVFTNYANVSEDRWHLFSTFTFIYKFNINDELL